MRSDGGSSEHEEKKNVWRNRQTFYPENFSVFLPRHSCHFLPFSSASVSKNGKSWRALSGTSPLISQTAVLASLWSNGKRMALKVWDKVSPICVSLAFNASTFQLQLRIFNLKSRQTRVPFLPIDVVTGNEFVWHLTWVKEGCLRSVSNSFVECIKLFFSLRALSVATVRLGPPSRHIGNEVWWCKLMKSKF